MSILWILLGIVLFCTAATLAISYGCFRMGFYAPRKKKVDSDAIETPEGAIYDPYRSKMEQWVREARQLPRQHFTVQSFDGLTWVNFLVNHFGPDVKIILTGISMGAATVMMTADKDLPPNVLGILADCGYSSPKAIICKVIRDMKLGARIFGHFDLEEGSPEEALRNAKVPVIFYHGEADDFVPCDMSRSNYEVCASRKALITIPGAGHGLSYALDPEHYLQTLSDFFGPEGTAKK